MCGEEGVLGAPSPRCGAPLEAAVAVLVGPQRDRAADDRVRGERAEVAAVHAVGSGPVHEEDFAIGDAAAALPGRQDTAGAIARQRVAHVDAVDRYMCAVAADLLS